MCRGSSLTQVLSRTGPELSEEIYQGLLDHATNGGYGVSRLQKSEQIPGVGEGGSSGSAGGNVADKGGLR